MEISNDLRTQRDRQADAALDADLALGAAEALGSAAQLGMTISTQGYPTSASAYYVLNPVDLGGAEVEGQAVEAVTIPGGFFAANLGTAIPPAGTIVVCHAVGKRWVFRYDG